MAASGAGSGYSGTPETENCSDIRLLLSALVDNEATPEEAARAKAHAAICSNCASHLAFLRLTGRALHQVPEVYPSASLSARIAAATYDRPTLADRLAGWLRPAPVRVGLGAALAASLALVLIVPRIGDVDTASLSSAPKKGVSVPVRNPATIAGAKVAKATPSGGPVKAVGAKTAPAAKLAAEPIVSVKLADAKLAEAKQAHKPVLSPSRLASALVPLTRPAPVVVAGISPRRTLKSPITEDLTLPSADTVIQSTRTGPRMDRHDSNRSSGLMMKRPGSGTITIPRSGYDRMAETARALRPREVAASAGVASAALAGGAPGIAPLLPESAAGKLVEPGTVIAERTAPRSPAVSAAVSVASVAEVPAGKLRFHTNSQRGSGSGVIPTDGLSRGGSLSAGDRYSFASGSTARIGITSAPVTGTN